MEDRNAVLETSGWVVFQHVFLQRRLEVYLAFLQQSKAMVDRIVDVDIVGGDVALNSPVFPSVSCPFGLTEVLACKMWASSVVLAPFTRLLRAWSLEQDVFEIGIAEAVALRP